MKNLEYFQPEYVRQFHCDGQKCSATCCKVWKIFIEKETYEKYLKIERRNPKFEITCHLKPCEGNRYLVELDENSRCPFLTQENLCRIQKNYGEEYLSLTCRTYPRHIFEISGFYEMTLSLTCPVAAELILFREDPINFEIVEVPAKSRAEMLIDSTTKNFSPIILNNIPMIQMTAIKILQERALSINRRLLMLGFYCDKLDEIFGEQKFEELPKVSEIYRDSNFLQEQAAQFSAVFKFNAYEHIKIILGLLENLYGKDGIQTSVDRKFLDAVTNTLQLKVDENEQLKISEVTKSYTALNSERENFINQFSTIFENYLVHEFFLNLYPYRFKGSLVFNFGILTTIYKMLELTAFSFCNEEKNFSKDIFLKVVRWYTSSIDHNKSYISKIENYMRGKLDLVQIIQDMLQV